tara:strand:+ start:406 stop:795 length:390 start_codon:yes stop_codon:yes gene_type:complete
MRQHKELDVNIENIEEKLYNIKSIVTELTSEVKILQKKISKRVKRKKKETLRKIKPELAQFMNLDEKICVSRENIIRFISKYVKTQNLQNKNNKSSFVVDDKLSILLKLDKGTNITFLAINKLISHLIY